MRGCAVNFSQVTPASPARGGGPEEPLAEPGAALAEQERSPSGHCPPAGLLLAPARAAPGAAPQWPGSCPGRAHSSPEPLQQLC